MKGVINTEENVNIASRKVCFKQYNSRMPFM